MMWVQGWGREWRIQRLLSALGVADAPAVPPAGKPMERGHRGLGQHWGSHMDVLIFWGFGKSRDSVWHQIPLWERLYRHLVEGHIQLGLHITSWGSDGRDQAIMCEHCWSFSAETRDRFQGGMDGGKQFMSIWDKYFCFQFSQWNINHNTSISGQPGMLIRSKMKQSSFDLELFISCFSS